MIIIFLGAPGSGKGTQAKQLSDARSWPQLSTGDMFREHISTKSDLGMKAKSFMDKGELVPDSVVVDMVAVRVKNPDCKNGFILDGFPRTTPQAEALDLQLKGMSRAVDRVVLFEIENEELVRRLTGRRTCPKCGSVFHLVSKKPQVEDLCDSCGHKGLKQRDDDRADVVHNRLDVYRKQTAPLIGYYQKQGKLRSISADQDFDAVFRDIIEATS